MFQSYGVHGPVLGPVAGLVIDIVLLGLAFWMLASPDMKKISNILTFITLIFGISLARILMAPLPNIQPVTVACLIIGAQLGARRGVAFAVLVTMISNFILGDGIWTIYQAIGWSIVAIIGAQSKLIIDNKLQLGKLYFLGIISAFLFDFIASLSVIGTVSGGEFIAYLIKSTTKKAKIKEVDDVKVQTKTIPLMPITKTCVSERSASKSANVSFSP